MDLKNRERMLFCDLNRERMLFRNFFRRYSVHCTISMAKISYRPHVTPFFSPIQEEDFPAPLGAQFEKPLTPVGQQRGRGE